MAGIYGVLISQNQSNNIYELFFNSSFVMTNHDEKKLNNNVFGWSVLNKFNEDRFFYDNQNYLICFDGINYSNIKKPVDFIREFQNKGIEFIRGLRGVFSGFIFDKGEQRIYVFNDFLATKSIFYYYDKRIGFIFSSEMHVLSKILSQNKLNKTYNLEAIYSLSIYGQIFDNHTPVEEIKRLGNGFILDYDIKSKTLNTLRYFKFEKNIFSKNLKNIINDIDDLMINSIKNEWQKDLDYDYNHISLISGGMDSRVNLMVAKSLGFDRIDTYTYGDKNSSDSIIAEKISTDNCFSHVQNGYGRGDYLYDNIFEDYIKSNDGLSIVTPVATMMSSIRKIDYSRYGLLHSGQIGDVLFGSFVRPNFDIKKNKDKIGLSGFVKSKKLMDKINTLDEILERYKNDYELYSYEQRQINGTLTGDRITSNYVDHASPFFDIDLIKYMLNVPQKYKLNQEIYFKWLSKRHPSVLKYRWEKTGLKPDSRLKRKYGAMYKKYSNGARKLLGFKYDSMNPISNWIKANGNIINELDKVFKVEIESVKNKELRKDLEAIYMNNTFEYRNKFTVITTLLSLKLHFNDKS